MIQFKLEKKELSKDKIKVFIDIYFMDSKVGEIQDEIVRKNGFELNEKEQDIFTDGLLSSLDIVNNTMEPLIKKIIEYMTKFVGEKDMIEKVIDKNIKNNFN